MKWRRIEIHVERREIRLHRVGGSGDDRCTACPAAPVLLRLEEAARALGVAAAEVYRRLEAGELHGRRTAEGEMKVCSASLTRRE